jgi:hypothetical protein
MRTNVRLSLPALGALLLGLIAFVTTGALGKLAWIVLAAAIGWVLGMIAEHFVGGLNQLHQAEDMLENCSKAELLRQAKRLRIEGRTTMDRKELVAAIVETKAARART